MIRLLLCFILLIGYIPVSASATTLESMTEEQIYQKRNELYTKMQSITQIPWHYFAAVDQYERNVRRARRDIPKATGVIGIYYKPEIWAGPLNPNPKDTNPSSIQFFSGVGQDGNGDGIADSTNDEDVLYTFATYLQSYGTDKENLKIALWDYYQRDKTVGLIMGHLRLYQTYQTLKLDKHAFPLPIRSNFSYKNTWGDARGWGGRRMHEGTDIFASYGVPVRSTCYGIIEIKGWNKFGGWRIGIRDINNTYHYFAHLNGFAKDLEVGQVVEPGQMIGSVGSSGYGPPGTAGKFPPHLHYGMYKDNGYTEWSFDPFPHLKSWERGDRRKR
ncbi:murein DD-endopeptidase MepM/ murein hydrolase activator NlpD [Bacillus tianshenii]|uniref:Murein DD-endopeptidase MepM/ murein hydrolase activator NlpD n=1 Tax=Sutcliffiella tianshenii TaxID=1463404 RepID=A0ABS2P4C1_9BACI|nr:M23 family metallopeptidase [Bacillus tianshenii]MBM7621822.1 murein DD-endopeptidase MepM/ murein hydrolase activator NlpD [Bacillus tianshenii]